MSEDSRFNVSTSGLVLLVVVGILVIAQVYVVNSLRTVQGQIAEVRGEQAKLTESANAEVAKEVAKMRGAAAAEAANREKTIEAVRDELDNTKRQAVGVAVQVKQEALKSVQDLASKVTTEQEKLKEEQTQSANELTGAIQQAATTAQSNIAAVSAQVTEVKNNVASTQSQLDRTIADLHKVTGDMGVMSGLIATNGNELAALRKLGDRNYFEFTLPRNKIPLQVGDVRLVLTKTDARRNRYTIEVNADDRTIEKKDRASNEPVQFYVGTSRQPHEIVINQVRKDQITGYLATPKVVTARK